jgi:M6 family metalloprotease-like protein
VKKPWQSIKGSVAIATLFLLVFIASFTPQKAAANNALLPFSDCKITSSRPGWNTVGFPIQQGFGGNRFERLPFAGTIKAIIIPVDFPNYVGKAEEITAYANNFTKETNEYFKTVSYGKVDFNFTILPEYIRMNAKAEDYGIGTWSTGDYGVYYREALSNAAQKFDLKGYDVAYVMAAPQTARSAITPGPAFISPVVVGNTQIPRGSATGGMDTGTSPWRWMVHETGHLFGLVDLYNVAGARAGQQSIHSPFGWWDIMSMNWDTFALELNAWFRIQTTWLAEADVYCLNSSSTTSLNLNISPLGSASGHRAVVIRLGQERVLVAEYRVISKYDSLNNLTANEGVLVYEVNGTIPTDAGPISILRKENMVSKSPPFHDIALKVGEFVELNGVLVGVSSKSNESASIRIAMGGDVLSTKEQLRSDLDLFTKAAAEKAAAEKAAAEKAAAEKAAAEKAAAEKAAAEKAAANSSKIKKIKTICKKGKMTIKVSGKDAKCPKGFRKK